MKPLKGTFKKKAGRVALYELSYTSLKQEV